MYTLYYSPGAASLVVHLALIEAGAEYELKHVDLAAGEQRSPAYLKLNPDGFVPTLLIDGIPHAEAAACLMTIADRHPQAQLSPAQGSPQRARWNQSILHLTNSMHPAFRLWFYPGDIDDSEAIQAAVKDSCRRRIESAWARLDDQLATSGPCLLGETFSAADLLLLMFMRWSRNMPRPATQWPALNEFALRMKRRPSWKRLCEAEGLTEWA
ncbi:MAG TPA: glutathione S-transferase [Rudaea sp.]|jgi:glutathione S-transferase